MTLEELKIKAMEKNTKSERVKFVMEYFFETVQYDYACLLAVGYAAKDVTGVSSNFKFIKFGLDNPDISEFVLMREVLNGKSEILEQMLLLREESQGSYEIYRKKLIEYMKRELKKHLDDDTVIEQNVESLMEKIEKDMKEKHLNVRLNTGESMLANYDISSVLIDYMLEPTVEFPPKIDNGLIVKGVCVDFSKNIVPILRDLDVETYELGGISELGHSWILVKTEDGYRSVDLTRAIFIRDSFLDIPKEQTPGDWLYTDLDRMFEMQKTRQIKEIDDFTLPEIITAANYTPEFFERVMQNKKDSISLKAVVETALREGIDKKDCDRAIELESAGIPNMGVDEDA